MHNPSTQASNVASIYDTNAFEAFASDQMSAGRRAGVARKAAGSPPVQIDPERLMAPGAQEKKLREKTELSRAYRRYKAAELRELLSGPYGREMVETRKFMRRLGIGDAEALIAHIRSLAWIEKLAPERRFTFRRMVAAGVARVRLRNGYPPFDDAVEMFGEEPDVATLVLQLLA